MRISILLVVAMVGRAAAADPAPTSATRQLMTKLGDGTVQVASLIDPTLGVWTFAGGKWTPNCSRNALLELMVRARVHASWYASFAQCTNGKVDATCRLANPTDTFVQPLELRFDRKPSGLVLRALVWGADQTPGNAPTTAICPGASPLPVPPRPVVAGARRDEPKDGKTPTSATRAMLNNLATGKWQLQDFADRELGLVILGDLPDARGPDDGPGRDRELRACGSQLAKELAALQKQLAKTIAQIDRGDGTAGCRNDKTTAHCALSIIGEWGPVMHLYFRQTERGLVLDGYAVFDEHQGSPQSLERHDVDIELALAHAWAEPCP